MIFYLCLLENLFSYSSKGHLDFKTTEKDTIWGQADYNLILQCGCSQYSLRNEEVKKQNIKRGMVHTELLLVKLASFALTPLFLVLKVKVEGVYFKQVGNNPYRMMVRGSL